jgi:hypothetical protein
MIGGGMKHALGVCIGVLIDYSKRFLCGVMGNNEMGNSRQLQLIFYS